MEIRENRAERGSYEVDVAPQGTQITVRLHLTPGPSVRATEYVFTGLVDDEYCTAPHDSNWSLCKVADYGAEDA